MSSVDVIVPCYRYGHFLRGCVKSVLEQRGVDVRILIIDDCSPDDTAEVALDLCGSDSRVAFVRHSVNRGHIATYNEGIDWIFAPFYLLLSADDFLLPGALRRTTEFMEANPSIGLAYGEAITLQDGDPIEDSGAEDAEFDWRIVSGPAFIRMSGARNCVPTPCAIVRTDLQKRLGGYRPELPHSGDMEMWLRLAAHADVGISQVHHAVYRRHANNMSLSYVAQSWLPDLRQRKAALDCFLSSGGVTLPRIEQMHRTALHFLAREAVGFASTAFNNQQMELSRQLSRFAVEISPDIVRSQCWFKLSCKRSIGFNAWCGMQASISRLRQSVYKQQI